MEATKTVNSSVFTGETGRSRGWSPSALANIGKRAALIVASATSRSLSVGTGGSGFIPLRIHWHSNLVPSLVREFALSAGFDLDLISACEIGAPLGSITIPA